MLSFRDTELRSSDGSLTRMSHSNAGRPGAGWPRTRRSTAPMIAVSTTNACSSAVPAGRAGANSRIGIWHSSGSIRPGKDTGSAQPCCAHGSGDAMRTGCPPTSNPRTGERTALPALRLPRHRHPGPAGGCTRCQHHVAAGRQQCPVWVVGFASTRAWSAASSCSAAGFGWCRRGSQAPM